MLLNSTKLNDNKPHDDFETDIIIGLIPTFHASELYVYSNLQVL